MAGPGPRASASRHGVTHLLGTGRSSPATHHRKGNQIVYDIKIIPDRKKTYTGVSIDARTGAILGVKQFGGVRGATGYARENAERKVDKTRKTTDGDRKMP